MINYLMKVGHLAPAEVPCFDRQSHLIAGSYPMLC
jgi:hypothetical protein